MTTVQSRPMTEARCSLCGWSEVSPRPAPDECPQCHGICPTCFAGGVDVMQEDVRSLLILLGLGDHARPISCHEVIQREILPAIRRHVAAATRRPARGRMDTCGGLCDTCSGCVDCLPPVPPKPRSTHDEG